LTSLEKPIYRFGQFELDPRERRLRLNGELIALTPKVFDTLLLLVDQAGRAVSKDTLMDALWPRGFVHESNLTKHIWLIRKALGDSEHAGTYIETVPKLGYRFAAPVVRSEREALDATGSARPADPAMATPAVTDRVEVPLVGDERAHAIQRSVQIESASMPSSGIADGDPDVRASIGEVRSAISSRSSRVRRALLFAAVVLLVCAIAFSFWRYGARETPLATSNSQGSTLAIANFNNLSQNAKDAWLGPALVEMLGTEVATGDRVHTLPDELVRPARMDLDAPMAGGYAPHSLATLRKRLGADYVLSGSYLVTGTADKPLLRLDLALQDARTGAAIANLSRLDEVAKLPYLVTQAGAALRDKLGIPVADSSERESLANTQPPTAEVARRIGFALDALHRYDPARARDELLDAVAQAPDYAPAYMRLAQAWSALGYKSKALAAAQQAMAHMEHLADDERLSIEAELYKAQFDWPKAGDTLRKLVAVQPQNPEPRLRLIEALLEGGKPDEADAMIAALRRMPGSTDDPRVELAAARGANARADPKGRAEHAEQALRQAQARDNPGLEALAREELGVALYDLGKYDEAEALQRQNIAYFQRAGNPRGEAFAHEALANVFSDDGHVDKAREEYQRSLALYQQIGDLNGQASSYDNISTALWAAGDGDGAQRAVNKALEIVRETGDMNRQAWNLNALATMQSDAAASDEAGQHFREAIALARQIDKPAVWYLSAYTGFLELRGDLDGARMQCAQAQSEAAGQSDRQLIAYAESQCAAIALDHGDVDAAIAGYLRSQAAAREIKDHYFDAIAALGVGQIEMGRKHWAAARESLEHAIGEFTTTADVAGEANAQGLLALSDAAMEKGADSIAAAARAGELRTRINQRQQVFVVDLALTQLRGRNGQRESAVVALRDLATDAEQRQWLSLALEAKLAALELLQEDNDTAAAAPLRREIEAQAKKHGFNWVLMRLHGVAAADTVHAARAL
jgi:DNA-binding winged helix-turn-helix (wHTH) protein/tetratricopeptide (TPR) repeat protein